MSIDLSPAVPSSFVGTDLSINLLSSTSLKSLGVHDMPREITSCFGISVVVNLEMYVFNILHYSTSLKVNKWKIV